MIFCRFKRNFCQLSSFSLLKFIFLLHTFSTFPLSTNALPKDSTENNEAIIQLSVDLIHVLKSSDARISSIEETIVDQEEKELLVSLLKSLDLENHGENESESLNTIKLPMTTYSGLSSSLTFLPSFLQFDEQPIAIPTMKTFLIVNEHSEPLEIYSISGVNNEFYSSFSKEISLEPDGGNVSIQIYYLPINFGKISRTLTIETNRGHFSYLIEGIGIDNIFRVHPLVNALVPLNSTFEQVIYFFNPFNHSIEISEIFTSDEHLVIELLSYKNSKNKISRNIQQNENWHLEPFELKPIIKLNYIAHRLGFLHGFVCIKTDNNDTVIIPVEIDVSNSSGLYSPVHIFSFNPDRLITSSSRPITAPLYVINHGSEPMTIIDIRFGETKHDYLKILWKNSYIPNHDDNLYKIADIIVVPEKVPIEMDEINDIIYITSSFPNGTINNLLIPIETRIVHGSVDYLREEVMLYQPSHNEAPFPTYFDKCHLIKLTNRFSTSIVFHKVTTKLNSSLSEYIQVNLTSSSIELQSNQVVDALCIKLKESVLNINKFESIQTIIEVHTNVSTIFVPFYLYNGFAKLKVPLDRSSGGIEWHGSHPHEFYIKSITQNSSQSVTLFIINNNPIEIQVKRFETNLQATIELDSIESLKSHTPVIPSNQFQRSSKINSFKIPGESRAIITINIRAVEPIGSYYKYLNIETSYNTIKSLFQYSIINGSIELNSQKPININVLVNRSGSTSLYLRNLFKETVNVTSISFTSFGACLSMTLTNNNLQQLSIFPDQTLMMGSLKFNMQTLCNDPIKSSTLNYFCRIDDHPEFNEQWKQYKSIIESEKMTFKLLQSYREFFYEWITRVRQQKLRSQIWLQTTHANLSRSLSINFHWPSVLGIMANPQPLTPVSLDFHLVSINTTKNLSILIDNPFPEPVTFSVEIFQSLFEMKRNQSSNKQIDPIFTLSTDFQEVQIDGRLFRFQLKSNERIIFSVSYRPMSVKKHQNLVLIRNNLTMLETILLRGEGGSGNLELGHRFPRGTKQQIIMEMTEKHGSLCTNEYENPKLLKILSLTNVGNMEAVIHDVSIGNQKCSGYGFYFENCVSIHLKPNEKYSIKIFYQPDYTTTEVKQLLVFNTNVGLITFPIVVRIPQNVMPTCLKTIPRPPWELKTHCLCLCSLTVFIMLVFTIAVYDSRRLFDQYLSRAEWRDRIQTTDNQIFDLKDLSIAVQQEQKKRDLSDPTKMTQLDEPRKVKSVDLTINDTKSKEQDRPARNSITSIEKTNHNSTKANRNNETPENTADSASEQTNTKTTRNKTRRGGADNGQSKTIKNNQELSPKTSTHTRQKSAIIPTVSVKPSAITPPAVQLSSAWSDDDSGPFQIARPRRVSMKAKEALMNNKTINSINESTSTSPMVSTSNVKSSNSSDNAENRQKPEKDFQDIKKNFVPFNRLSQKNNEQQRKNAIQNYNRNLQTSELSLENSKLLQLAISQAKLNTDEKVRKSRRPPRGRNPVRQVSSATKFTSGDLKTNKFENNQSNLPASDEEQSFAQLVEQLRAAGLPSSKTSCSMSIRSRCSSAPPSEHGGLPDDDEDEFDDDLECWDAPEKPDDDFSFYANQTEEFLVSNNKMSNTKTTDQDQSMKTYENSITNSVNTTETPRKSTGFVPLSATLSDPVRQDKNGQLVQSQMSPGPIQRPNKLPWSTTSPMFSLSAETLQSPTTPDVLVQINHILHHQNSIQSLPVTPCAAPEDRASTPISEIPTINIPWTPFSTNGWPSNLESGWTVNTPPNNETILKSSSQNPFMTKLNPTSKSTVWPTALGTATPNSIPADLTTQEASIWNEFISRTASSNSSLKASNDVPVKIWPSTITTTATSHSPSNSEQTEGNNTFWNSVNLNDSQSGSIPWWSKSPSNQNSSIEQDQSRWDFAR